MAYNIASNISKGWAAYYASLPATNDALIAVVLETTGIQSEDNLRGHTTLASLLSSNTEQTVMGRKTLTGVTVTTNHTDDAVYIDCNDITWTAATGNAASALVICYDPDTTGGDDTSIVPIGILDFPATPSGGDINYLVFSTGFYKAS